jgi:uncharacterized protein YdeI (YjbR/CyaY-like superfamily)
MTEQTELYFKNREDWRNWLEQNHLKSEGIWMVYFKKHTKKESIIYNEGVEEALCFGWIDSIIKSIDNERYKQKYTPRRKNSVWSVVNKKRVEKMIKEGKMTEAGLKLVEDAKKNGRWDKAYDNKVKPEMPVDLLEALKMNLKAYENFMKFAPGHQTTYIHWLNSAKREETKKSRIEKIINFALLNQKPGMM